MGYTKAEKLQLLMLCDIYKKLNIEGGFNPDIISGAISSGNLWAIDVEYSMLIGDEVSDNVRENVVSALNCYRYISASLNNLHVTDKDELVTEFKLHIHDKQVQFPGYDGNNEGEYSSVARMFGELGRFSEQVEIDKNSHEENRHAYSDMSVYVRGVSDPLALTKEQLKELLSLAPTFWG
ncbi:YfbU family protein [Serratia liquefaciens]|uniref:YfbU family protein n=1 Tax=Serratia liquefaciens TaxID=614 RepID=UPI003D02C974